MNPRPDAPTRRQFLRRVGHVGGAGVLLSTMGTLGLTACSDTGSGTGSGAGAAPFRPPRPGDFTLTGRSAASVVILGAGVSGLSAAYELGKAGYRCTILEAQNRVGGRSLTVRGGTEYTEIGGATQRAAYAEGQYLNAGPARLAPWMVTLDYCRELGVGVEPFCNVNAEAYIYREKDGMAPGQAVKRRAATADVYGYVAELLAKATDQGALDALMNGEDRERLLDMLRDWGSIGKRIPDDPGRSWVYDGSESRGFATYPGAADQPGVPAGPVPSLADVLRSQVGHELDFDANYEQAATMLQPVGGMDAIPRALADAVGRDTIRLGAVVTGITDGPDRVAVTYRGPDGAEQRIEADFCIATLPPQLAARIPHNLGPDVQRALTTLQAVNAGKIGLEYRSRWWETDDNIYGGITETDLDLTHVWYPSTGFGGERGVIVGYYNTKAKADAYTPLAHADREARAVEQGTRIHGPKYRGELASSFSIAWARAPYAEAGWQDVPGGPADPVYTPLHRPGGRVYFSGDWMSHTPSWQHGALTAMRSTVTALHARAVAR